MRNGRGKYAYSHFSSSKKKKAEGERYKGSGNAEPNSSTAESWKSPDIYQIRAKEYLEDFAVGVVLVAALAFFFYRRAIAFVFLSPLIIGFVWLRENERRRRRFEQMEKQFVDALTSLSGALKAGYSVENALEEVVKELEILYGPEVSITQEFRVICGKLDVNRRPEEALMEFADRSRLEDAAVFAEVFAVAVRSGGDLIAVIGRTTEMIGEKLRAQQEIRTAIRARQFEQKVMNAMPLGILLYMEVVSPGYLGPVYGNLPGVIVMSIGLLMYGGAFWLGKSMTEIEV